MQAKLKVAQYISMQTVHIKWH